MTCNNESDNQKLSSKSLGEASGSESDHVVITPSIKTAEFKSWCFRWFCAFKLIFKFFYLRFQVRYLKILLFKQRLHLLKSNLEIRYLTFRCSRCEKLLDNV